MSWLAKRALIFAGVAVAVGVASAVGWPGDVNNEPMTGGHWLAVGGFFVTAVLLVVAAVLAGMAVTGDAWRVKQFKLDAYLDDMKKDR
ncbi:MAG: hypothetical protein OEP52_13115 [Acidimicrobiia bacterium]|nr:hypothetical protein [Acidimicrobiia bacterium]